MTTSQAYTHDEVEARLRSALPQWRLKDGHICRTYRTHGWKGTLMVVGVVGHLAEAAWHHPELAVSYASVEIRLQTHDAGGITAKDFELAAKIEEVMMWQPARTGGALPGTPKDPAHAYIRYDD